MRSMRGVVGAILVLVVVAGMWWQREGARIAPSGGAPSTRETQGTQETAAQAAPGTDQARPRGKSVAPSARIGFRSHERLVEHYRKHGAEFGSISQDEYLARAQSLRDRPAGGDVLERVRKDGVITRFDRGSGAFLAVNRDLTIRTFFRPNQGERYFWRQLER